MCVILPGCPTKAWPKRTKKKKKRSELHRFLDSLTAVWKCFSSGVKGNVGEVVSPPLLVLMSECLRRAPWKRSVGSCWTAKGASSGEVRPPVLLPLLLLLLLLYRKPWTAHGSTRQDKRAGRQADRQRGGQTGGTLLLSCLAVNMLQAGPVSLTCLNANTP